ncbi:SLBB domain-containing protein [Catenovulum agarivorans]|uniref:SLBB domain-containing protein n=1 Tax=Catenovulum agarivorans TaxID=1172192 RepID=UPI00036BD7D7|nr:SLBB domain-containing protein [Catenovulum agarivorans]
MKQFMLAKIFALAAGITLVQTTYAAAPSQEQIAQFKQLPKAQQQALAAQYGINLNEINQSVNSEKVTNPNVVDARSVDDAVVTEIDKGVSSSTGLASEGDAKQQGKKARVLKPFGYELFAGSPSTFAPATDVPVPSEYVIGPGDTVKVQLFGKEFKNYELAVDRNGSITMPETGPMQVVGMSFTEFKNFINQQIEQKVIGAKANVTMGALRSIRVFVLGEAYKPGAYTVSSLSSITHALFVSGGVTEVGSLRNVQLKRKGKVVTTFDLYDLLLKGDTANDTNLLPGDVVFVPPVGATVGIDGEVKRPAIYELKGEETADELINLAGGYLATAYPKASKIERISKQGERTVIDLDLTQNNRKQQKLTNGDVVRVYSILDSRENVVSVNGHVQRPGAFSWRKGLRVSDLINNIKDLKAEPDLMYSIVVREHQPLRTISAMQFSIGKVLENSNSADNIKLQPRDRVYIFGANQSRELAGVLAQLRSQARATEPAKIVSITGNVEFSGSYPLTNNMTVEQLLQAAYDYKIDTDLKFALLQRRNRNPKRTWFEQIDLTSGSTKNIQLKAEDRLFVFSSNNTRSEQIGDLAGALLELQQQTRNGEPANIVQVTGNVKFPAYFPLATDMTVGDLLLAAHDIKLETDLDYMLLKRRNYQLDRFEFETLSMRNAQDLSLKLQPQDKLYVFAQNASRAAAIGDLVAQIKAQNNKQNRELLVNINGEVRFPGTYPLSSNMTIAELIDAAGGYTEASYLNEMNISRFDSNLIDSSEFILETIDLTTTSIEEYQLQPRDTVLVKKIPEWRDHETVTLMGEFKFPGNYTINKGETLAQLIQRAGGFTDDAFLDASIFTRSYLKAKEQKLLDEAEKKLRRELVSTQINSGEAGNADTILALLDQLQAAQATGRMIINRDQLLDIEESVQLRDGDVLIIPTINQAVSVIGEVYAPTAQIYKSSWNLEDYVAAAGGYNQLAERSDAYIIKANGRVVSNIGWFSFDDAVEPGDTIVVPTNVDPVPALTIWKEVTGIIYQSTVAIAAVAAL